MPSPSAVAPASNSASITSRVASVSLLVFTLLNFANYVDRYVLPPVLEKLKHDPAFAGVSDARLGGLQTAFFIAYMVFSPIAGLLGRRVPRKYLIAVGVGIWSVATVLSGLARNYGELFAARALIGAGEGGYATLAPAILSDLFGPGKRSRVMAIFYVATPVGSAMGIILGGLVAQHWSWRAAFFMAGGPGLILGICSLFLREPERGALEGGTKGLPRTAVLDELRALLRNRRYLRVNLVTTLITFSLGGLAFWMPSYFQEARGLDAEHAGYAVGLSAVGAGLLGTIAGGFVGDHFLKRDPHALFRVSGIAMLMGIPLIVACTFLPGLALPIAALAGAEFFFFFNTGPINTALVESAPASFREGALGINLMLIHLLGDAVSPALMGALAGALSSSLGRGRALGVADAATAIPLFICALACLVGLDWDDRKGSTKTLA